MFFTCFFGRIELYTCLFICTVFSNGVLLYESKDLVESDGDVTVRGNPTNGCGFFSEALEKSTKCHSQKINQSINSKVKWNILESVFFNENILKISQIDTYQIHKLPLPPLGSIYLQWLHLKSSTSTLSDQTQPVVQTLQPFQSSATMGHQKNLYKTSNIRGYKRITQKKQRNFFNS